VRLKPGIEACEFFEACRIVQPEKLAAFEPTRPSTREAFYKRSLYVPKPSREACSGENFLSLRSQDLRLKPVVEAGEFFEACEVFEPSKLAASEACT